MVCAKLSVLHVVVLERAVALSAKPRFGDVRGLGAHRPIDAKGQLGLGTRAAIEAHSGSSALKISVVVGDKASACAMTSCVWSISAVAIQLVAEQVEQHEVRGLEARQDAHGVQLVALEHAHAALAGGAAAIGVGFEQGSGNARLHIVAGSVAHAARAARRHGVGDEVRRGGLAVGTGDDHARVEQAGKMGDELGIDGEAELAGQGAPAAV